MIEIGTLVLDCKPGMVVTIGDDVKIKIGVRPGKIGQKRMIIMAPKSMEIKRWVETEDGLVQMKKEV